MSKLALSFSRLSTFEQCEAKFDYLYVSKVVKDTPSDASEYGERVHKTLQLVGQGKLPAKLSLEQQQTVDRWGGLVEFLVSRTKGKAYFEHQLTVDHNLKPVDWFSKQAYIRAIIDLLIIDGDIAYCFDYKTGKRKEDDTQLKLFALMIFWCFPEIKTVKSAYIWLPTNQKDTATYQRDDVDALWSSLGQRLNKVQETVDLGYFEFSPSGLCGWCPAEKICPNARTRR